MFFFLHHIVCGLLRCAASSLPLQHGVQKPATIGAPQLRARVSPPRRRAALFCCPVFLRPVCRRGPNRRAGSAGWTPRVWPSAAGGGRRAAAGGRARTKCTRHAARAAWRCCWLPAPGRQWAERPAARRAVLRQRAAPARGRPAVRLGAASTRAKGCSRTGQQAGQGAHRSAARCRQTGAKPSRCANGQTGKSVCCARAAGALGPGTWC